MRSLNFCGNAITCFIFMLMNGRKLRGKGYVKPLLGRVGLEAGFSQPDDDLIQIVFGGWAMFW